MNASNLLDEVIKTQGLKNDAALSRALEVAPPVISKLRHGKLPIGSTLLLRIHDVTTWPLDKIRVLASLPVYKHGDN